MNNIKGKVAIVTGAAQGIGLEIASDLAQRGARVLLSDVNSPKPAVQSLLQQGLDVAGIITDVSDQDDVQKMVEFAEKTFGRIDVLVNNAGLFTGLSRVGFDELSIGEWKRVLDVNVTGPFLCSRAVWPAMKRAGAGRIIHITSATFFSAPPRLLHYVASKGALMGMTRCMAREMGVDSITVNAVAPGFTLSAGVIQQGNSGTQAHTERARAARCLSRDQMPQDLSGAVAFFASDASAFITGQTLVVDGGACFN